jgi:hypothetical protein
VRLLQLLCFFVPYFITPYSSTPSEMIADSEKSAARHRIVLKQVNSPTPLLRQAIILGGTSKSQTISSPRLDPETPNPLDPNAEDSSELPVGAWVGIGLGILLFILVGVYYFVGHKRVTDYFVKIISARLKRKEVPGGRSRNSEHDTLDSLEVRCSSKSENRYGSKPGSSIGNYDTSSGTPRTVIEAIVAPIEIDSEGRISPRLPIGGSRRSTSSIN